MAKIKKVACVLALIVWSLCMVLIFFIAKLIPFYNEQQLPRLFHQGVCKIAGLKPIVIGAISTDKPLLFVSNHISYLDIFVMGGYLPGYFVAKSEVASWPVLNKLAKLQNTIFVERRASKAKLQTKLLQGHLSQGNNIILYPEGTSTNGAEVKQFKSSLFAVAETDEYDLNVQPVSIAYTVFQGEGMNQTARDNFAWYAEMPFLGHFLNVLSKPKVEVELTLHPTVKYSEFNDRKALARHCELAVRQGVESSLERSGSTL